MGNMWKPLCQTSPLPPKRSLNKNNKDNMQVEKTDYQIAGKNIHNDPCVSLVEISSYKQFLQFHYRQPQLKFPRAPMRSLSTLEGSNCAKKPWPSSVLRVGEKKHECALICIIYHMSHILYIPISSTSILCNLKQYLKVITRS